MTFDNAPAQGSNNPVRSGGIYNAIGGVNALTFLQAYDSSVSQLSAGFVFTPQGAYNMYTNISNTIPSVAASVASSMINSITTKVIPSQASNFTIEITDWSGGSATITGTFNVGTGYSNEVVPTIGERATWDYYGVYPISITASSITFQCATTPGADLTFKVLQTIVADMPSNNG